MSVAMVLKCDDTFDAGMPCRGAFPFPLTTPGSVEQVARFHADATRAGWTLGDDGRHRCPAHTRLVRTAQAPAP